jgi:hypothetical protein
MLFLPLVFRVLLSSQPPTSLCLQTYCSSSRGKARNRGL